MATFRSISIVAKRLDASRFQLCMEVGLSPEDVVFNGDPAPSPKRGQSPPNFRGHVYCGQTAVWIKMPLGTEVCLGPDDIVLDGDPAPLPKRRQSPYPIFCSCLLWPNRWMDQVATWHGGGPWSRPHCARWGPSSLPQKVAEPPIFGPFLL